MTDDSDGDWIGEGNFLELNSSIPPADRIAFIDHQLLWSEQDEADEFLWQQLVSSLREQSPQIRAVLIATVLPAWSNNLEDSNMFLCLIHGAWDIDAGVQTIALVEDWNSRLYPEARDWKLFLRSQDDRQSSSRVCLVDQDCELSVLLEHLQVNLLDGTG